MTPTELRLLFPSAEKCIHLNHAGASPIAFPVADAVRDVLLGMMGENPVAPYMALLQKSTELRGVIGRMIGTAPENIAIVKNTSQGLSIISEGVPFQPGENIVVTRSEYPSNLYPWMAQEKRGVQTRLVEPRADGYVAEEDLEAACDDKTRVLAVSWIQWGTGQRMDLERLGNFCLQRGILLVIDVVQGVGAMHLQLDKYPGVAFATAGSHKWMMTPGGMGFLYVRPDVLNTLLPTNVGWNWVQNPIAWETLQWGSPKETTARFEEGTPNLLGTSALLASLSLLEQVGFAQVEARVLELADYLRQRLKERGMYVVSPHGDESRSGIVSFRHPVVANAEIEKTLMDAGILCAVRCGNVRLSPHVYTNEADIDTAIETIPA